VPSWIDLFIRKESGLHKLSEHNFRINDGISSHPADLDDFNSLKILFTSSGVVLCKVLKLTEGILTLFRNNLAFTESALKFKRWQVVAKKLLK